MPHPVSWILSSLYILHVNPHQTQLAQLVGILSHFPEFLFTQLRVPLVVQKHFTFISSYLPLLVLVLGQQDAMSKVLLYTYIMWGKPRFSSSTLRVSSFTLRSLIHLVLNFVQGDIYDFNFTLLYLAIQHSQYFQNL